MHVYAHSWNGRNKVKPMREKSLRISGRFATALLIVCPSVVFAQSDSETGIRQFEDGGVYEGGFRNGRQHGFGTYVSPNGYRYSGNWFDGQVHGHGTAESSMEPFTKGISLPGHRRGVDESGSRMEASTRAIGSKAKSPAWEFSPIQMARFMTANSAMDRGTDQVF